MLHRTGMAGLLDKDKIAYSIYTIGNEVHWEIEKPQCAIAEKEFAEVVHLGLQGTSVGQPIPGTISIVPGDYLYRAASTFDAHNYASKLHTLFTKINCRHLPTVVLEIWQEFNTVYMHQIHVPTALRAQSPALLFSSGDAGFKISVAIAGELNPSGIVVCQDAMFEHCISAISLTNVEEAAAYLKQCLDTVTSYNVKLTESSVLKFTIEQVGKVADYNQLLIVPQHVIDLKRETPLGHVWMQARVNGSGICSMNYETWQGDIIDLQVYITPTAGLIETKYELKDFALILKGSCTVTETKIGDRNQLVVTCNA